MGQRKLTPPPCKHMYARGSTLPFSSPALHVFYGSLSSWSQLKVGDHRSIHLKLESLTTLAVETFAGRNFRALASFSVPRESLYL